MARNLYTKVGQSTVDNLIADNLIYQKRVAVSLPAGTYARGQLLVLSDDGQAASIPAADATRIDCVLLDEVGEITEETQAAVALTGEFNRNAVLWGEIPEAGEDAIVRDAWDRQLHIAPMHQAPYIEFGEG